MAQVKRVSRQPAFVLRRRPYSESSLLVEIFSLDFGVQVLLAKGARRLKSNYRGLLHCFQPLSLSWSGRRELMTLTQAENFQYCPPMPLQEMILASYANELLLRFLHRGDPHEQLFNAYANLLDRFRRTEDSEWCLRLFEKYILADIGYGLVLDHDVMDNQAITQAVQYIYVPDRGPIRKDICELSGLEVLGHTLVDLNREEVGHLESRRQSKRLMQMCIAVHLNTRPLNSRIFFQQLSRFEQRIAS